MIRFALTSLGCLAAIAGAFQPTATFPKLAVARRHLQPHFLSSHEDSSGFSARTSRRMVPPHWISRHSSSPLPKTKRSTTVQSSSSTDSYHVPDSSLQLKKFLPGTYGLMLAQLVVFLLDKILSHGNNPIVKKTLYLWHSGYWRGFKMWQPLTSLFCHRNRMHLSGNMFVLFLLGRNVEAEYGTKGLVASFLMCGVASSLVSLCLIPGRTISAGAAGALMGLFIMSTASTAKYLLKSDNILSHWRTLLELGVTGEFVIRQFIEEVSTPAFGGRRAVNLVGHFAGAFAAAVASRWVVSKTINHQIRLPKYNNIRTIQSNMVEEKEEQYTQQPYQERKVQHKPNNQRFTQHPFKESSEYKRNGQSYTEQPYAGQPFQEKQPFQESSWSSVENVRDQEIVPELVPKKMERKTNDSSWRSWRSPWSNNNELGLRRSSPTEEEPQYPVYANERSAETSLYRSTHNNRGSDLSQGTSLESVETQSVNRFFPKKPSNTQPQSLGQRFCNEDRRAGEQGQLFGDGYENAQEFRQKHEAAKIMSQRPRVTLNGHEVAASVTPEGRINYGMDTGMKIEPEKHWWMRD